MKKYFIALSLFSCFFFQDVPKAEAVTWWHTVEFCRLTNNRSGVEYISCSRTNLLQATVNTDKTFYAPGETMNLSASVYNPTCSNGYQIYSLTAGLGGQSLSLSSGVINGGGQVIYSSGTLVAPTIPGAYNITTTVCAQWPSQQCTSRTIPITVSSPLPVTGTVSGSGCEIAANASSCPGSATWNITNPTTPDLYNSNGTVYTNSASGSNAPITLSYGSNTVSARNAGSILASTVLTTSCATGLSWNGSSCVAPSATISGTGCTITTLGDDSCMGTATWNISNAASPNVYNNNGTTYSINPSGTNQSITLLYGLNNIFARNGAITLATTNLNAVCDSTLAWDGSGCTVPPPPPPQINISVDRELIRSGDTVEVSSQVTASYPVSCTLSGVESSPITFTHTPGGTNTSNYTYTSRPLTSAQIVSLSCAANPAITGVGPASAEERISVVPMIQEI